MDKLKRGNGATTAYVNHKQTFTLSPLRQVHEIFLIINLFCKIGSINKHKQLHITFLHDI